MGSTVAPADATPASSGSGSVTEQAEALLGRGETKAAIALLSKAAETDPKNAGIWNLLSYGHMLDKQWQAAADAGRRALELDKSHPYALYNTGMAEVELKEYPAAINHLQRAAKAQPDRAEPLLGLARAYVETGRLALATEAVAAARKLAPDAVGAAELALAGMVQRTAPADLAAAKVRLEDGAYTISVYPGAGEAPTVVYLTGPEGVVGLPVGGFTPADWARFWRVDLPGGAVGYFIPGGEMVGAYVSGSSPYRLFVRTPDGRFQQVVFFGSDEMMVPRDADFLRSAGVPKVQGDKLIATYGDDASGKTTIKVTWQFKLDEMKATFVERVQLNQDSRK
jgi:Tfp pilus assembly protein PilF